MKTYSKKEILKAAEIGEISMIDAKHLCSLLEKAKKEVKDKYSCRTCQLMFMNPFDEYFCKKDDFEPVKGKDCKGKFYIKK